MQVKSITKTVASNIAFTSEHDKINALYSKYHVSYNQRVRLASEFIRSHSTQSFVKWLENKLPTLDTKK